METLGAWLPILGIVLIFWLLLIRPAQRRQKQLRSLQDSLTVGDPVLTSAGIFGTVARIEDDKVGVEVADGVVITLARGAIVGLVKEPDTEPEVEQPGSDLEQGQE